MTDHEFTINEAALESLPMPFLVHDHQRVLFVNRAALGMLGARNKSEVVDKPLSQIIHPDGREAGAVRRQLVLEGGHPATDIPVKLVGVDGIVRYAIATGVPIIYGRGHNAILVTAVLTRIGEEAPGLRPQE